MATNTSEIKVTQLDFDLIKANLIEYFRSDPTFQDYEFEGSALNIMMDILSYNTHINSVTANLSANEMFIDSAQMRQSVVSLAKSLGYTPRSKRAAVAQINLEFTGVTGFPPYLTMVAGTRFTTDQGIIFSTKEDELIYPKEDGEIGEYFIANVEIFEGFLNTFQYTFDDTDPTQKFEIPSKDADTTSLRVVNVTGTTAVEFERNENLTLNDGSSNVYYLAENFDGVFEVTFGDGIIGNKPINSSFINLSYIISKYGEEVNNSKTFLKTQLIDGWNDYTITTTIPAYGAAPIESKEEIQFRAPKMYKSQSRAVTTEDYENFMLKAYPWIESMSIWGGEYNVPPVYGRVFIAIKPKHTEFLSDSLKKVVKDDLITKYNVVTIQPVLVDPDFIYMLVDSDVQYDMSSTILSENEIISIIKADIKTYFADNTEKFNKPFYFSSLVNTISDSEVSIVNSLSDVKMMKKFFPTAGSSAQRILNFGNAITPGTVISTYYNITGTIGSTAKQRIVDDSNGTLYTESGITGETINANVGTVDYENGILEFTINPYSLPPDTLDIRLYCTPVVKNVTSGFNQIILCDDSAAAQDFGREQGIKISITPENKDYK